MPDFDDHIVELLRGAGTISLGKTATPEFGLPCYTETDIGPPAPKPVGHLAAGRRLERGSGRGGCRRLRADRAGQ